MDGALDVGAIIGTQGCFDITANRIELAGNFFDVRVVQMCVLGYLGDGDVASRSRPFRCGDFFTAGANVSASPSATHPRAGLHPKRYEADTDW